MTRYKPKSIEEEGIDTYLNRTAGVHNDVDFRQFSGFVERKMSITSIKKAMDVRTWRTAKKYVTLYKKWKQEQPAIKVRHEAEVEALRSD